MLSPRSTYLWNAPAEVADRERLAERLADADCQQLWLKAGGDGGYAWIPGEAESIPWKPRPQWNAHWVADFAPLRVDPWFYIHPGLADFDAIIRALGTYRTDTLALNPETEWRVSSPANPFRSLDEANAAAATWVAGLRSRLRAAFGQEFAIGFSAVPSWSDFPYEGFAQGCDFAHPQHYWFAGAIGGLSQVALHLERSPRPIPNHPILAASREHDDEDVVELARIALADDPGLAGLSAWEAGNAAFQLAAMRRAWALLPEPAAPEGPPAENAIVEFFRKAVA